MEQKQDCGLGEKKQLPNIKSENNYNSFHNRNLSFRNSDFHMENQNFHKKVNSIDINKKEELSNSLNKNDSIDNKILNTNELNEKARDSKKINSIDQNELLFNINQCENKNNNTILNYYKDIDINFKLSKINNNCKNFLPKKNLLENLNKNIIHNMQNCVPCTDYQKIYSNNPFIFNDNRFQSFYYFPENAFNINNEYNSYFITNINKYCCNFNNNKNKEKKKKLLNLDFIQLI